MLIDFQYFQVASFAVTAALFYVMTLRFFRWAYRSVFKK